MKLESCQYCGCVCDLDRLKVSIIEMAEKESDIKKSSESMDNEYDWYICPCCRKVNYNFND